MEPPYIITSQVVFPGPGYPTGFVVLTWDGGPDHPYADVWVKVNGGKESFVVEQGKAPAERGKIYVYILTDAGKTLSTVSFRKTMKQTE